MPLESKLSDGIHLQMTYRCSGLHLAPSSIYEYNFGYIFIIMVMNFGHYSLNIGVHSWIKIKKEFCGFCVFCGRVKNEVEDILLLLPSSPPMPGKATGASSARDGVGGGALQGFYFYAI